MNEHNAALDIKIVTIVVSESGKFQRTIIIVTDGKRMYLYRVDMEGEGVCIVAPMQEPKPIEKSAEFIADLLNTHIRTGKKCTVSFGNIENVEEIAIQAHYVLGPAEKEPEYVHVRYDFPVGVKTEILKRLLQAPSECFYTNIPRSCGKITDPVKVQ